MGNEISDSEFLDSLLEGACKEINVEIMKRLAEHEIDLAIKRRKEEFKGMSTLNGAHLIAKGRWEEVNEIRKGNRHRLG